MALKRLIRGNPAIFDWALLDDDETTVDDLVDADQVAFIMRTAGQLTTDLSNAALLLKVTSDPLKVLLNDPATGDVKVKADSLDMDLAPGVYDLYLEASFSNPRGLEYQQLRSIQIVDEGVA